MLQYQTRAGVLPNPCNCGLLEKLGLLDDFTLGALPVLPKNACSQLPKVPPCLRRSGFAQAGARLLENSRRIVRRLPGEAAQHPCPVSISFFWNWRENPLH
jgi:hypothetical protein